MKEWNFSTRCEEHEHAVPSSLDTEGMFGPWVTRPAFDMPFRTAPSSPQQSGPICGLPGREIPRRCDPRQNLTGASPRQVMKSISRASQLVLTLKAREGDRALDHIEQQLDDISPIAAKRLRWATHVLRAANLALRDDSLGALAIALSHQGEHAPEKARVALSTVCRLGFWQLDRPNAFRAVPRQPPRARWSRSHAISAVTDMSIDAAIAFEGLHMGVAKRLALDALSIAEAANLPAGFQAVPASAAAQVLYEEGWLDEADKMLRDRLPAIKAEAPIDGALRAYLVLIRIARQRQQYDFASLLQHEAEALGEHRGWPRLVAASLAERVVLLLEVGNASEARLVAEHLDRFADTHRAVSGYSSNEIAHYRAMSHARVSWAETPSAETAAIVRRLYHHAIHRRDFHTGCRLSIELAEMLACLGEAEEADALFLNAIQAGMAAGLYEVFLEREQSKALLKRASRQEAQVDSLHTAPFVRSLLARWQARQPIRRSPAMGLTLRDALTARERDIVGKIGQGLPNKQIARALGVSPETVKWHMKRIFLKLSATSRAEAVARAKTLDMS